MFEDGDQEAEDLASRLYCLLSGFKGREGALEALGAYGIVLSEQEDTE